MPYCRPRRRTGSARRCSPTPALTEAMHACDVASRHRRRAGAAAGSHCRLTPQAPQAQGDIAREQAWWLGLAWWAAGRAALELTRQDEGRHALHERAVAHYTRPPTHRRPKTAENACVTWPRGARATSTRRPGAAVRPAPAPRPPWRARAIAGWYARRLPRATASGPLACNEQAALVLAEAVTRIRKSDFDKAAQQWVDSACPTCTRQRSSPSCARSPSTGPPSGAGPASACRTTRRQRTCRTRAAPHIPWAGELLKPGRRGRTSHRAAALPCGAHQTQLCPNGTRPPRCQGMAR